MHQLTLAEIARGLAAKEFSAEELTRGLLARIHQLDPQLNSFISITDEPAIEQAKAADARRSAGEQGALLGAPIAHKDLFCTEGVLTSCASKILSGFKAPYDATVVARLKAAGAVSLGKLNMDEFAMGSSNESSHYGAVKNPWALDRVPGGSSGGSAAAVAARLVPAATGTDTGGSIRQPAAFTNLTGIKPTYGRVSRWGMIAYASSLDQGGPLARTAEDCALMLGAIAGFDPKDSTSVDQPVDDYLAGLNQPLAGLRIGLPKEYFGAGLDSRIADAVMAVVEELKKLGATVKEISLPNMQHAIPAYYVIAPAEASSNLSRFDGVRFGYRCENPQNLEDLYKRSRAEGFGAEVKRRIMVGTYALSAGYYDAYYLKAQKIRRLIKNDFISAFNEVDVILGPTTPNPAWKLGEKNNDPVAQYLEDIYTITANLAGVPGLSMPAGFIDGLPVGVQLLAPYFQESRLLNVAHQYQQATDWHKRAPAGF
ncbi:Asp-tRNA(Asn)/Glu-tRNA(Gln) amidotransferase subunit GatA [Pseudomonas sp. JS3066]|jgi:aspartyl-tRNA(Asn)/glutamyl-tRNA(Gln) amidotransferase subunit A|uniref:Asp-tRNA(Asn)/Glu-tRNA(Gln) amidotransferase subunit GatA n=1 Tax=unclassified Pseudomonas TaxID=196821 RepID=UPI000EA97B29|nr:MULTISPECIES: Asp-tRNA(Asn)/Glu-tRNA(Gln) amidotransferase subunit GatA [unclassified Pseudomonas]AYF88355.1 Asp-tRNA(Asn)/Glu-tRNA(Gln) amidotransferase subunit GatA [Pseudomonas sp. DY-1]MDH4654639.1 Asp-tRNA(Asn)/Glu-tRNA(Gln) amidotransferase subunit GatA [Pseudomonas sp. BN606]MRK24064.1 Asp-tRNA(Asn)/Glu-tRNA(Gln) amidotransferase subunit GatA [Pseudomonas sp. JG-B]WVK94099.1 Asp-tRNA(Asn)/Glu-tRNA(Gln) amidotransferase subunit GatA [Pseudomonas sp. JS3066]